MRAPIVFAIIFTVISLQVYAIPNPSAVYCDMHGTGEMRENEKGQYGICVFEDGIECDEWAYFCKCAQTATAYSTCPADTIATCAEDCVEGECGKAGKSSLVLGCCEGLDNLKPPRLYGLGCREKRMIGWSHICSDCGNGICDPWENVCNCDSDCSLISRISLTNSIIILLLVLGIILVGIHLSHRKKYGRGSGRG